MLSESISKFNIKVLKIGRKWITIEDYGKGQVELNDITKDFEVGGEYEIYAKCIKESNRYGTTKKYYPIGEEVYKEIEKDKQESKFEKLLSRYESFDKRHSDTKQRLIKLAEGKPDLLVKIEVIEKKLYEKELVAKKNSILDKINNSLSFNSNSSYKCEYILNIITGDMIYNLRDYYPSLYEEIEVVALKTYKTIIENMSSISNQITYINKLKELFNVDSNEDYNLLISQIIKNCNSKYIDELSKMEKLLEEDISVSTMFEYNKDFCYLKKHHLIDENLINKINDFNQKSKSIDNSKYNYLINNVFSIKDFNSFKMNLNSIGIEDEDIIEEIFNEYKFIDDKIYLLNFRLEREYFKKFKDKSYLIEVKLPSRYNFIRYREYVSINPYLLLSELISDEILTLEEEIITEEENKIMLWSSELTKPFEYRVDEAYGETYYFVTKELYSQRLQSNYKAYYIVGWDSDTQTGFSHRIPWQKDEYENMAIKEILDYTFKFDSGYKRIQGDVIAKECECEIIKEDIEHMKRILIINNGIKDRVIKDDTNKLSGISISKMKKEQEEETIFRKYDYRKNLYVEGDEVILTSHLYKKCKVYCNDKLIKIFDRPVMFNQSEIGEKLKYNLYYEEVDYSIEYETYYEYKEYYEFKDIFSNRYKNYRNEKYYLGEHLLSGNVLDSDGVYIPNSNIDGASRVYCFGPFTLVHGEHKAVVHGEKNKGYIVELAKRHKKKNIINPD